MPRLKTKLEKYAFCLIGRRLSEDHLVVKIEAGVKRPWLLQPPRGGLFSSSWQRLTFSW
jgi:hypothetical protein